MYVENVFVALLANLHVIIVSFWQWTKRDIFTHIFSHIWRIWWNRCDVFGSFSWMKFHIWNNPLFSSFFVNEFICVKTSRLVHRTFLLVIYFRKDLRRFLILWWPRSEISDHWGTDQNGKEGRHVPSSAGKQKGQRSVLISTPIVSIYGGCCRHSSVNCFRHQFFLVRSKLIVLI